MTSNTLSKDGYLKEPGPSEEDKPHNYSDMETEEEEEKLLRDNEEEISPGQKPHGNQTEQKHKVKEPNKPPN